MALDAVPGRRSPSHQFWACWRKNWAPLGAQLHDASHIRTHRNENDSQLLAAFQFIPCSYFGFPHLTSDPFLSYPHLLYPQFKHVAHPSIRMTALVLHLWHIVAPGGNALADSASEDSSSSRRAVSPIAPAR